MSAKEEALLARILQKGKLESMYVSIAFRLDILPGKLRTRLAMSH